MLWLSFYQFFIVCYEGMEFQQDAQKVMSGFMLKVTLSFKVFQLDENQEVEVVLRSGRLVKMALHI